MQDSLPTQHKLNQYPIKGITVYISLTIIAFMSASFCIVSISSTRLIFKCSRLVETPFLTQASQSPCQNQQPVWRFSLLDKFSQVKDNFVINCIIFCNIYSHSVNFCTVKFTKVISCRIVKEKRKKDTRKKKKVIYMLQLRICILKFSIKFNHMVTG